MPRTGYTSTTLKISSYERLQKIGAQIVMEQDNNDSLTVPEVIDMLIAEYELSTENKIAD